ncbi:hypothetical protein, partial [Streptomyces sp. 130]
MVIALVGENGAGKSTL